MTGTRPMGGVDQSESQGSHDSRRRRPGSHTQPELRGPDETGKGAHTHRTPQEGGEEPRDVHSKERRYSSQTVWGSEAPEGANQHTH